MKSSSMDTESPVTLSRYLDREKVIRYFAHIYSKPKELFYYVQCIFTPSVRTGRLQKWR